MKVKPLFALIPAFLITASLLPEPSPRNSPAPACPETNLVELNNCYYPSPDTLRPDPICNMKVDDKKGDTIHYKGHIFGFCSRYCRAEFVKNPDAYLPKKN